MFVDLKVLKLQKTLTVNPFLWKRWHTHPNTMITLQHSTAAPTNTVRNTIVDDNHPSILSGSVAEKRLQNSYL